MSALVTRASMVEPASIEWMDSRAAAHLDSVEYGVKEVSVLMLTYHVLCFSQLRLCVARWWVYNENVLADIAFVSVCNLSVTLFNCIASEVKFESVVSFFFVAGHRRVLCFSWSLWCKCQLPEYSWFLSLFVQSWIHWRRENMQR